MLSFIGKISRVIRVVLVGFAILFVTSVGHVGAEPMPAHDMASGTHKSKSRSPACADVCSPATLKGEKDELLNSEDQDDEPLPFASQSYYALSARFVIPKKPSNNNSERYLVARPPDLIKLYSNYRF